MPLYVSISPSFFDAGTSILSCVIQSYFVDAFDGLLINSIPAPYTSSEGLLLAILEFTVMPFQ